jgi:alkylation response protein AidB-like acyl-CoA dehydrogenase
MDGADLELFERSLRHATEQETGAALDDALDELGWSEALVDDPRAAVSLLFGLQGEAGVASGALDRVLLHALGADPAAPMAVVLPPIGSWDPPGRVEGDRLDVQGVATSRLTAADTAAIVAVADGKDVLVHVPAASLDGRAVEGLDPALGLVEVDVRGIVVDDPFMPLATGWSSAVAAGRVAVAHELVGASRTMLSLAREHALDRVQFGVPISSFQAVRHRLAETLVAVETADAVVDASWLDRSDLAAAMAKSVAGRSARTTAKHCQQVLAGIGFTTEHPFHRYVRRVLVLDGLLGRSATLTEHLGRDLLASRELPPLLPL